MPSFMRRSRKGAKSSVATPSRNSSTVGTPDRNNKSAAYTGRKNSKRTSNQATKKHHSSPRGVADDDIFVSDISSDDEGSSGSDDNISTSDESSLDDAEALVGIIKHVFTGSNEADSLSGSSGEGNLTDKSKSYSKLCYRLGINDGNLVEMDIDCGLMGKEIAKEMAKFLPDNNRLTKLCITCSSDKRQRQIFRILLCGLAGNSSVSDLEIRGADRANMQEASGTLTDSSISETFHLDREVANWLGTVLARHQTVQKICLKKCRFVDSGLAVLFMGMQHSKIQNLSIISCNLEGFSADIVSASLCLMKLTSLSLVDTSLTTDSLRFLCEKIKTTPSITQLNLSRNKLGRQEVALIASSLKSPEHDPLRELVLSCCGLDDVCVHHLVKGLKQNPSLSIIDLSENDFGDQGALYLKGLLEKNSAIKELRVDGCKIESRKRIMAIADGLRYNNSVLKSFGFSASTSLAILQTVDAIEEMGGQIGSSVSEAVNMS